MGHLSIWEYRLSATPSHRSLSGGSVWLVLLCLAALSSSVRSFCISSVTSSVTSSWWKSSRMACACSTLIRKNSRFWLMRWGSKALWRLFQFWDNHFFWPCTQIYTQTEWELLWYIVPSSVYQCLPVWSCLFLQVLASQGLSEDKLFRIPYRCFFRDYCTVCLCL